MFKKMARILGYLKEHKAQIVLYFVTNVLAIVFSVLSLTTLIPVLNVLFRGNAASQVPVVGGRGLVSQMTATVQQLVQQHDKTTSLAWICVAVIVFTVLKNLFLYLSVYILSPIRNAVILRLRDDMFTKTLSLPIGFFTEERKGDLLSRMTNDITEVEWSVMSVLETFIREPLTIIFYFGAMIFISVKLTLFLLIFLPVAGLAIGLVGKSLRKSSNLAQEQLGTMLGIIDETLAGMRVIKSFNAEKNQHLRFMKVNNLLFRTRNLINARRELASPMSETLGIVAVAVILWYGGSLVLSNKGDLQAETFLTYLAMFSQLITPFKNLSSAVSTVQKGNAALDRIEYLLGAENTLVEAPNAKPVKVFNNSIELRNVHFSYGDKKILNGIDLTIPKGKTIALVGASGAGKSTLVDLIPRFHDVTSGEILIDGINVRDLKIDDVRRLMGVVGQDPMLFNDTIYNNIILGTGGATKERVEEAATVAHAHTFIIGKPDGYDTVAGDRGTRLSGGERQRITIARAILKNPPILILDEATSSLDTESERIVQDAINKLMQNRTCIVIAHRLSTVQHADEIIVLEKGAVVERGTHAALIAANGKYKRLVDMQQVK